MKIKTKVSCKWIDVQDIEIKCDDNSCLIIKENKKGFEIRHVQYKMTEKTSNMVIIPSLTNVIDLLFIKKGNKDENRIIRKNS